MQWSDLLEILKYTVPALVVFLTAYLLLKLFLDGERERKELEVRAARYKDSLPIRLQAYERLTLFLERINPTSMLQRVNKPGMSALDLQRALIVNIRVEFEHNLSQQIYVSPEVWMQIVQVKEELISIINRVASELPDTATGKDLARAWLEYFIKTESAVPTQRALDALKSEVKKIY
ncbi:MAG: hypothetical protein RMK52_02615 [Chitinophagales bacterium]|nr:hypothetical protein [Chitinophagales bacterium]MDW8393115.1 hypothetical protein [Chitinophagales bacterium]